MARSFGCELKGDHRPHGIIHERIFTSTLLTFLTQISLENGKFFIFHEIILLGNLKLAKLNGLSLLTLMY